MQFGSGAYPKSEYARTLAATLAHFLNRQRDVVGVARFDSTVTDYLPARWRPGHMKRVYSLLSRPSEGAATDLAKTIAELNRLCRKRSLIVFISDFLSDPASWRRDLSHLAASGHDLRVLQILDPAEETLDFGKAAQWQDIETGQQLYVDPDVARARYLERFVARQAAVANAMSELGIRQQVVSTDQPLDLALLTFIRDLSTPLKRNRRNNAS